MFLGMIGVTLRTKSPMRPRVNFKVALCVLKRRVQKILMDSQFDLRGRLSSVIQTGYQRM
jgi:hypothetical protein